MAIISTKNDKSLDGTPHPVFDKLMQDVEAISGRLVIRDERFEFWAKRLRQKYPRQEQPVLYRQIFAAAALLASTRTPAALQLFALACLGLHPVLAWRAAQGQEVFMTQEAQKLRIKTDTVSRSGLSAGLEPSQPRGALPRSKGRQP